MCSDWTPSAKIDELQKRLSQCEEKLTAAEAHSKNLEADRLHLAAIVEGSRDAIWAWTTDGIITRWNDAAQRLFGYTPKELIGQTLLQLIPEQRRKLALVIVKNLRNGKGYEQHETIRLRKDGVPVDVELTVSPILDGDGRVVGGSTVCRDITDRKQFEVSLAKRVQELTALYELTENLQRAKTLPDIYKSALDAIGSVLGCERASILLFNANSVMRFVAWRGLTDEYRSAVDGHSPWTSDVIDPSPIFVADILETDEPPALKSIITREGIRGLAFVPLVSNGRLIGKFMTYHRVPHRFTENEMSLANTIARQLAQAVAQRTAEEELRHSEARFKLMSESAPVMIWISDAEGRCVHLNRMLRDFWALDEHSIGNFDWTATIHPDDAGAVGKTMTDALARRAPVAVKGRYLSFKNVYRVLETHATPRFSANGKFEGMIGVNVDVTERDEAERARELLVAELNHRVKNTLSVVQGIAHQTFKSPSKPEEARKSFEGRLLALAQAHNLLTRANWENASLQELAETTLNFQGQNSRERISLSGPPVLLPPKEAVSIAMALHELSTNAMKYGALSNETGHVSVTWGCTNDAPPCLKVEWVERDGPPVKPPVRRGFGSLLLDRTLAQDLGGEVRTSFDPEGLLCSIVAPIKNLETRNGGFVG